MELCDAVGVCTYFPPLPLPAAGTRSWSICTPTTRTTSCTTRKACTRWVCAWMGTGEGRVLHSCARKCVNHQWGGGRAEGHLDACNQRVATLCMQPKIREGKKRKKCISGSILNLLLISPPPESLCIHELLHFSLAMQVGAELIPCRLFTCSAPPMSSTIHASTPPLPSPQAGEYVEASKAAV